MVKRALLIGINYTNSRYALRGCINDAHNMRDYLLSKGFEKDNIKVMTDLDSDVSKAGILKAIKEFVSSIKAEDHCVFSYSGHGGQTIDRSGDEIDGADETICAFLKPSTIEEITDDELRVELVDNLIDGATLRCIFDSCHSATVLDLPWYYLPRSKVRRDIRERISTKNVISVNGCVDSRSSTDAFVNGQAQGALTSSLLTALKHLKEDTWEELALLIDYELRKGKYEQTSVMATTDQQFLKKKVDL